MKKLITAALSAATVVLAGCASGHPGATSASRPPTSATPALPESSSPLPTAPPWPSNGTPQPAVASTPTSATGCSGMTGDIKVALKDLRISDRHYQEAWVSGGYGKALRNLIADTSGATSTVATGFNSDASSYLAANSPYLAPGWESQYRTVNHDIKALAAACGVG